MFKHIIVSAMALSAPFLMAGGNTASALCKTAKIHGKTCKPNKIYLERDVDLMWEDKPYTEAEEGAYMRYHSLGKVGTQQHALSYCKRLKYAGYTDWRLPTSDELSHVHRKDGQVFSYATEHDFWSSSIAERGKGYVVYPVDANRYKRKQNQVNYIRCVRCMAK